MRHFLGALDVGISDQQVIAYGELLAVHNSFAQLSPNTSSHTSVLYNGESFDSRIGQLYLRARWYDMHQFTTVDPFTGNASDPLSFNKYGFVHANPVMGIDPTGMWNYFAEIGKVAHTLISELYDVAHPSEARFGKQVAGTKGAILPDIMNITRGTIAEIKPLSASGVAGGYVQLNAAINIANGMKWTYGGKSYEVDPVPNMADKPWTKDKWSPGIQILKPSTVDSYWNDDLIVTLGNYSGLLLYQRIKIPKTKQTPVILAQVLETAKETVRNLAIDTDGKLDPTSLEVTRQLFEFQFDVMFTIYALSTVALVGGTLGLAYTISHASMNVSLGVPM